MNTKFVTASVFSLVSSSIVQAADVVVPEEPIHAASSVVVLPPFSWSGFYFGAQIGGFSSKISAMTPDVNIPLFPDNEARSKPWIPVEKKYLPELSGFIGGLYAGFNFDLGNNFIWGVDTDIILTDKKDTITKTEESGNDEQGIEESGTEENGNGENGNGENGTGENGTESNDSGGKKAGVVKVRAVGVYRTAAEKNSATFNHTLKQKWTGATRVRVGFSTGRIMPYIAGGVAYGQFQDILSMSITGDDPFNRTSDVKKTMIGYTLGGGIDFAITDNFIVRAEYRYSDFGKAKFNDEIEIKYKTNDFRAGIAYKF
ncbi:MULTISPECIES: outer membrane protein [unclassified Bartonella]|uniref:outer membrane protein n=1 Tax=unclassified Bartonella TaxID=2645622 RepID=UPI002360AE1A|nr:MULTISPECIES: outer membrane protein [unclassified Bartonella]